MKVICFGFFILISVLIFLLGSAVSSKARKGDGKSSLEIRLFRAGGLKIKEERYIKQRERGVPCLKFSGFFPDKAESYLYFKPTDGRQPKPKVWEKGIPDGWILHVACSRGGANRAAA